MATVGVICLIMLGKQEFLLYYVTLNISKSSDVTCSKQQNPQDPWCRCPHHAVSFSPRFAPNLSNCTILVSMHHTV